MKSVRFVGRWCFYIIPVYTLVHMDFQVDVYGRVLVSVGVQCSFISRDRNADEAWPNKLIKSSKHSGPMPRHRQLFLRARERPGGDTRLLLCRQTTGMCLLSLTV